jgi:hypothetical protein
MKPIKLTPRQWRIIREHIVEEYKSTPSVIMFRNKMREVLGFTPREHTEYNPDFVERNIMLDFYSEPMRTMFLLKYSHILNDK